MVKVKKHQDEARAEQRRRQVLEAAERCFVQRGFHNTSMAEISAAANMSVGHIYNYFKSKEDIISALAGQECATLFVEMGENTDSLPALVRALQEQARKEVRQISDEQQLSLIHDIMAELGRNPQITATVRDLDLLSREQLRKLCARFKPDLPAKQINATVEVALLLLYGYCHRKALNPNLDQNAYADEVCRALALLLA